DSVGGELAVQRVHNRRFGETRRAAGNAGRDVGSVVVLDQIEIEILDAIARQEYCARSIHANRVSRQFGATAENTRGGDAEGARIHLVLRAAQVDRDLRVGCRVAAANVNAVQRVQLSTGRETDVRSLLRDLRHQLLIFHIDIGSIALECGAGRFGSQCLEAIENGGDVAEAAIGDLQRVHALVSV